MLVLFVIGIVLDIAHGVGVMRVGWYPHGERSYQMIWIIPFIVLAVAPLHAFTSSRSVKLTLVILVLSAILAGIGVAIAYVTVAVIFVGRGA